MITQSNFSDLLLTLGFENQGNVYSKTINHSTLQADFNNEKLIYPPDLTVNENQTTNFSAPENFVVFECVHRLLEKGYQPKHLELEKRWKLGHTAKSGRADITVFADDKKSKIFMIIECKTGGIEYEKAFKQLHEDGGQLFSYFQQDTSTQCLVLYASDFAETKLSYKNTVIRCKDEQSIIEQAKKDKNIALYTNAKKVEELHLVWKKTYHSQTRNQLVFGDHSVAYNFDKAPLRKRDLKELDLNDKLINKFEEILRHNAVSDKENAFNRLIALFISKLADEKDKQDDQEMDFQYKIGETYEEFQDRLQKLYQIGMEKFMKEEITYVSNSIVKDTFAHIGNRQEAIKALEEAITTLKFYSNNDFAFKDVHNRTLFEQNSKILVEMVQLFEQYRIIHPSKHQFLGDLFEQLLNKGFKQNEGQFFTPSPITRFVWDCLPLNKIIDAKGGDYPKVIDYACGSGHFLTEAVEAINAVKSADNNNWTRDSIYGIEKDYRLARVSKVSMFMNGAGDSNIIFGDGLDNAADKGIANGQFDILVANPPYSVSAFKSHLKLKNNDLKLLENISNNGGEIEVLFCERISQLLKSGGVGAVILPSSILSNDSASYTAARSLLLDAFFLRAVVNFGSKTFGATGTNTAVLFLEKRPYPPTLSGLAHDQASMLFAGDDDKLQEADKRVYFAYLQHLGISEVVYNKLRQKSASWAFISGDMGDDYLNSLAKTIIGKISLSKTQEKLPEKEQQAVKSAQFFTKFAEIEQEKIALFALLYQDKTLIINAPTDNAKQKEFLGYDWSNRKGAEGIQILNAGGKLYNHSDRLAPNTLAAAVRTMFEHQCLNLQCEQADYAILAKTVDMLDFEIVNFNKVLRVNIQKKQKVTSKYPLKRLDSLLLSVQGNKTKIGSKEIQPLGKIPVVTQEAGNLISGYTDNSEAITDLPLIVFGDHSCTFKYVDFPFIRGADGTQLLKVNEEIILTKYLFNYLLSIEVENADKYERHFKYLKIQEIPLPPLAIQQEICQKCEEIDHLYENSRMKIEEYRAKIAEIFNRLEIAQWGG